MGTPGRTRHPRRHALGDPRSMDARPPRGTGTGDDGVPDMTTIDGLDVSVYTVPTDGPEGDGTLGWDSTTGPPATTSVWGSPTPAGPVPP
jgi:hypothetical protein